MSWALPARAEIFYPSSELTFSPELQVAETGYRGEFNADPDGGTPATAGHSNLALADSGALAFESSRIPPTATYGEDKVSNGVYGVGTPDLDDATRPWINADDDAGGFVGVLLSETFDVGAIGFGSRFVMRSDGTFTLEVTAADFAGVNLDDPAQVAALTWIPVGTLTSTTSDEFGRHVVSFDPVQDVTAVRIVVSQGGTSITEIEVYEDVTIILPPTPDPPASPTAYTNAVLADSPIHYYRFEETHAQQPAKDAIGAQPDGALPGGFHGSVTAGRPSAFPVLGLAVEFSGTPGTLVDLGAPFHPGASASIEAWVKLEPTALGGTYYPIAARWDGSYELDVNTGGLFKSNFVTRNNAGEFALAEGIDVFSTSQWHHVVGIFDRGVSTIYVDGVQGTTAGSSATGLELQNSGETLFIGSTRDGSAFNWIGLIDEVAFYDYALSPGQIEAHVAAATGGCTETPDRIAISGPRSGPAGTAVQLTAALEGVDAGGTQSFLWEVLDGVATISPPNAAVVDVTKSEAGTVEIRVSGNDGVCDGNVTASCRLTFVSSGDPPAEPTEYTNAVLADGPVHYYRFEESDTLQLAKDGIGAPPLGEQPGSFTGGVTAGRPSYTPPLGNACGFDGQAGTYVDLGVPFHTGDSISVEAWVYLDPAAAVPFHPIAARWDGSYELDVSEGAGLANFVSRNSGGEFALAQGSTPFTKGAWHHVVGVFDEGITTIYVDGVQGTPADTSATGLELQDAGLTLFIGSTREGNGLNWLGMIDEVAFYDHALSLERIQAHFSAAGERCQEDEDGVSISGPALGAVGAAVTLTATLTGGDAGGTAAYAWSVEQGPATVQESGDGAATVTCSGPGEIVVRVNADDGVCGENRGATATHSICCEEADRVTIEGPLAAPLDGQVTLKAVFDGIEAGATAEYTWTLVSGVTSFTEGDGGNIFVTCVEQGPVTFRVDVGDGVCLDEATAEATLSCGVAGNRFVRGDADGDGTINITDGIVVLSFLFLGGQEPPCQEAANANNDAGLNITDAIIILNFLFRGGVQPPPPYPQCGEDPSDRDTVDCARSHERCQ